METRMSSSWSSRRVSSFCSSCYAIPLQPRRSISRYATSVAILVLISLRYDSGNQCCGFRQATIDTRALMLAWTCFCKHMVSGKRTFARKFESYSHIHSVFWETLRTLFSAMLDTNSHQKLI